MAKELGSDGRPRDVPTRPATIGDSPKPGTKEGLPKRDAKEASPKRGAADNRRRAAGTAPPRKPRGRIELGEEATVVAGARRRRGADGGGSGATTRPPLSFPSDGDSRSKEAGGAGSPPRRQYRPGDEGDTVMWDGAGRSRRGEGAAPASRAAQVNPVTGWLVVVDGPGKGSAAQLGFGHNTIGRGPAMRVRLDFGDRKISRDTHATLTYDPKGNAFYLQQGKTLAYIDGKPVLSPLRLEAGAVIELGDTKLRFMPFCDDGFTWE